MEREAGERSRSDSDFSELGEGVKGDHEERAVDVMKRGLGGARETGSSAEVSYTSSFEVNICVRSSAFVWWRSLDMARREKRGAGRQKRW